MGLTKSTTAGADMKAGVTRNRAANRLVAERNAELKTAKTDAERDAIIATYTERIAAAKTGD